MEDPLSSISIFILTLLIILFFVISLFQNAFDITNHTRLSHVDFKYQNIVDKLNKLIDNKLLKQSFRINKVIIIITVLFLLPKNLIMYIIIAAIVCIIEYITFNITSRNPEKYLINFYNLFLIVHYLFIPIYAFSHLINIIFKPHQNDNITEEELLDIIQEAKEDGAIDENESTLIKRSIAFYDLIAEDILIPRVEIIALNYTATYEQIDKIMRENEYSRYPVYNENIDNIIGIIHSKDFYFSDKNDFHIDQIMTKPIFVIESTPLNKLLQQIRQNQSHMAIVIDEYGGTAGLITLENIIEELIGEIWDEHDDVEIPIKLLQPNKYLVLGSCDIETFEETTNIKITQNDDENMSINGWIIDQYGKIPSNKTIIETKQFTIRIVNADEKKIIKAIIEIKIPD